MEVAILTVGDELLAGDTVNTNATWLAERLTERGVRVERVVTLPDRVEDVATEVNEARATYDAVLVTGGVGPTHDDVTLAGVAAALGVPVEPHPDALEWFEDHDRYAREDLLDGTADLPRGARFLPNSEGVAPGAVVAGEDGVPVYVMPGVPAELEAMFESVEAEFSGPARFVREIETANPESSLIDLFDRVQERFPVVVGSYPGETVRIKVQGEDEEALERAVSWLEDRIGDA